MTTVNGAINIAENVLVDGEVEAVNGEIDLDTGSEVRRNVSNVNGKIELRASKVGGDVSTVSGDIELADAAEVMGDIVVEKPNGWGWGNKKSRIPKVVIGPGSRVHGDIRIEREAELYISGKWPYFRILKSPAHRRAFPCVPTSVPDGYPSRYFHEGA